METKTKVSARFTLFFAKNTLGIILGAEYLCWNFALKLEEEEFDETVKEDARAKKCRIQSELSKALASLGVKHSTFHSLLQSGKKQRVSTKIFIFYIHQFLDFFFR